MTCTQALLSLFLLTPCTGGAGGTDPVLAALAQESRPATDVARDAARKPAEVLGFLGIRPGMHVLEVFAGGGYYTQILDAVVGPQGRLLAHNNQAYMDFVGSEFSPRFENGGLPNTKELVSEVNDIQLPSQSLDAVLLVLAWHDFLFAEEQYDWPDVDEQAFLEDMCEAMKPGAVLGIVDHVANPGGDSTQVALGLHRIDPELIKSAILGSCFELGGESDVLRNPADDHTTSAVQGPLKGYTDQVVYRFIRK